MHKYQTYRGPLSCCHRSPTIAWSIQASFAKSISTTSSGRALLQHCIDFYYLCPELSSALIWQTTPKYNQRRSICTMFKRSVKPACQRIITGEEAWLRSSQTCMDCVSCNHTLRVFTNPNPAAIYYPIPKDLPATQIKQCSDSKVESMHSACHRPTQQENDSQRNPE